LGRLDKRRPFQETISSFWNNNRFNQRIEYQFFNRPSAINRKENWKAGGNQVIRE